MGIADRLPDVDRRWLILLLVLLLVIVGIGIGGIPEEQDDEPGTARLTVATPTPTPTPTPTAGGSGAPTGADGSPTQTPGGEDTATTTERSTPTTSDSTPAESETPTRTERDDDRRSGGGGGSGGGGDPGGESTVDVQVAGSGARIAYTDAVPGTADRAELVLANVGNGTGQLTVGEVRVRDVENGITEPEAAVDDTPDAGELSEHVMVVVEAHGSDGTVEYLYGTENGPRSLASLGTGETAATDVRLDPGEEARIVVDWHIPESTGDEIQSDATQFDLVFGLRAVPS